MAALDPYEKERVRYHLGYPNVGSMASLSFGVPIPIETMFLVEQSMNSLLDVAVDRVRSILNNLDYIEAKQIRAIPHLAADSLGDMTLAGAGGNGMLETDRLDREYIKWAGKLADQLGCTTYAYSLRFKAQGGRAGNIRVRNS